MRAVSGQPAKFPFWGFPWLSHRTKKSVYREQYRDRIFFSKAMLIQGISYCVLCSVQLHVELWTVDCSALARQVLVGLTLECCFL